MKRSATAVWKGSGKEGSGALTLDSGLMKEVSYSWRTRFQDPEGTSPEELLAAAHAACFSMKLSFVLGHAGFTPNSLQTSCTITIENGVISNAHLVVVGEVPGISAEVFQNCAEDAKQNCPVSKVLNTNITMEARLT
ncbi:MAG: OsmC family peroxiredoxin [Chitinophagales bacterium]|nr:OsmC family peroxiredoxin [Chitinophagales bacterium]MDW8393202.1 OsmC family peroxiredoxin [Chitinophagales bacterium]